MPLEELDKRLMVAWPATCDQPVMERALGSRGAQPRIVFRSANNETLLSMVRVGLGCAVLPKLAVAGVKDDHHLRIQPLDPAPSREIHLHRPTSRSLSPLAMRAIELAREIADELCERQQSEQVDRS